MKSEQWIKDREFLRTCARGENTRKNEGLDATVLYCLISHMRGKLHMKTYAKHCGGWRIRGAFGPDWYNILDLDDQQAFLKGHEEVIMWAGNPEFHAVARRIVYNGYEEEQDAMQPEAVALSA